MAAGTLAIKRKDSVGKTDEFYHPQVSIVALSGTFGLVISALKNEFKFVKTKASLDVVVANCTRSSKPNKKKASSTVENSRTTTTTMKIIRDGISEKRRDLAFGILSQPPHVPLIPGCSPTLISTYEAAVIHTIRNKYRSSLSLF